MDLELDDDQRALRDGIVALLEGRFGSDRVRAGFDRAMYDELASAGVFSLRADGFAWADAVVVYEALGRYCVPGPLVACLLAPGSIAGIVGPDVPAWIEHVDVLDTLFVLGRDDVRRVDPRVLSTEPSPWSLDPVTPVARADTLPVGERIDADAREWRNAGATLTAAVLTGIAQRCTDLAVAYAQERVQFDRPIASFQAIKHLCADMLTRTEVARAAVYAAGAHLDAPDVPGLDTSVSVAKVMGGEAALANAKSATQVHGGMGFTWEVDVHLSLKRAWVLDTHYGSADRHADLVADSLRT
jgi:alkylation response protein AidB-like acyl-CoA dehydrogenase